MAHFNHRRIGPAFIVAGLFLVAGLVLISRAASNPTVTSISPSSGSGSVSITSVGGTGFIRGWDKESGLRGNWRMDETSGLTVADLSGNGFNGTASGTATTTGKLSNARDITQASDAISFGDVADISQTDAASISFWWKGTPASNRFVVEKNQNSGTYSGYAVWHYDYGSGVRLIWQIGENDVGGKRTRCSTSSPIPTDGLWHHYVITQVGGTSCANNVAIYIDGVQQSLTSEDSGAGGSVNAEPLCVGVCGTVAGAGSAVGTIDELRIYNAAVSADDVTALYNATGPGSVKLTKTGQADITCTAFTYSSSTAMTAGVCDVTGVATGAWNVKLTNPDGGNGTLTDGFTVTGASGPTVTSVSPSSACAGRVALGVSIGGSNFKRGWDREDCLVANWRMDEASGLTVSDLSGNGFNGTASGTATTTGKLGSARDITQTSDAINFGDVADISQTSPAAISFWWKGTPASNRYVVEKNQNSGTYSGYAVWHFDYGSGVRLIWQIGENDVSGKRTRCSTSSPIPTDGLWHHYVVVQAGGTSCTNNVAIYIDGVSQSLTAEDSGAGNSVNSEPLCVGVCGAVGGAGAAVGAIDELRIYSQAISAGDVTALYNATGPGSVRLTKSGQSDITCSGFAYFSSSTLTGGACDVSGAATGAWNAVVTNPDNVSGTLADGFTVR